MGLYQKKWITYIKYFSKTTIVIGKLDHQRTRTEACTPTIYLEIGVEVNKTILASISYVSCLNEDLQEFFTIPMHN